MREINMKTTSLLKIITVLSSLTIIALVLSLTSCSSSEPTATKTVTQAPVTPVVDNNALLSAVRDQDPYFNAGSDSQIIDLANSICTNLRNGSSLQDILDASVGNIGTDHATVITAGAILFVCPDMQYLISN